MQANSLQELTATTTVADLPFGVCVIFFLFVVMATVRNGSKVVLCVVDTGTSDGPWSCLGTSELPGNVSVVENVSTDLFTFIYWVFSHTNAFKVIWRLPSFTGGGRPPTKTKYQNVWYRMYGQNHWPAEGQLEDLPT